MKNRVVTITIDLTDDSPLSDEDLGDVINREMYRLNAWKHLRQDIRHVAYAEGGQSAECLSCDLTVQTLKG